MTIYFPKQSDIALSPKKKIDCTVFIRSYITYHNITYPGFSNLDLVSSF